MNLVILWLPRGLAIIITVLVFLFAVGSTVGQGSDWFMPLLASLPGLVILIATAVAWRHPFFGGIVFVALSLSYLFQAYRRADLSNYTSLIIMVGIPLLAGILFLLQRSNTDYVAQQQEQIKQK